MNGSPLRIHVRCIGVLPSLRSTGVRCFSQVLLDGTLFVDGLAVRVSRDGQALVTWPERRDGSGRGHAIVRIFDPEIRKAVERAVLSEAVRGGWLDQSYVRAGDPTPSGRAAP